MDRKVKRGVAIYSYSGEYGRTMNLEDCFKDMQDMGATGIEILANSHIDSYPELSEEYAAKWEYLCGKYGIEPVEYGHWIDTRLYKNRDMSLEEAREKLINDFKIANRLGFKILRTKMGVINGELAPVENWREIIKSVLPEAEKYDVTMCPEIHLTTVLADQLWTSSRRPAPVTSVSTSISPFSRTDSTCPASWYLTPTASTPSPRRSSVSFLMSSASTPSSIRWTTTSTS